MSNFRNYTIVENFLASVFIAIASKWAVAFTIMCLLLSILASFVGYDSGVYLINGTADEFYKTHWAGVHLAILHLLSFYILIFTKELVSGTLDTLHARITKGAYKTIVAKYGVDNIKRVSI